MAPKKFFLMVIQSFYADIYFPLDISRWLDASAHGSNLVEISHNSEGSIPFKEWI